MKKNLLILLLSITSLFSCGDEDLSDLSEVVYVRRNGADMPAYIYGNGASKTFIIILHGGPGGSGLEYRSGIFSKELENKYGVVYWDQRGQGMSQGHYAGSEVTLDEMAKDVNALALVLKHKYGQDAKLFLMGHSWGGMLGSATMVSDDFQHNFAGWIEVDGAHDFPDLYRGIVKDFITIGTEQIQAGNDVEFWTESVSIAQSADTSKVDSDVFGQLNSKGFEGEEKLQASGVIDPSDETAIGLNVLFQNNLLTTTIAGALTANRLFNDDKLEGVSLTAQLSKIEIPSLILWGRYDLIVPGRLAHSAFNNIGSENKELVFFEKSGHSPMDTEPDKFVKEVVDFIEAN